MSRSADSRTRIEKLVDMYERGTPGESAAARDRLEAMGAWPPPPRRPVAQQPPPPPPPRPTGFSWGFTTSSSATNGTSTSTNYGSFYVHIRVRH